MSYFYLLFVNVLTFGIYGLDKVFARRGSFRVSENILFLFSLLGGSLGAIIGMKFFRHKTKKLRFKIFNLLTFVMWFVIIILSIFN